jgi:hypothetical protein
MTQMIDFLALTPETIRYRNAISRNDVFLTEPACTLNDAQVMLEKGYITQRDYNRYYRCWANSSFHSFSDVQDRIFALGGMPALERRYARSRNLHQAWRSKVISLNKEKKCDQLSTELQSLISDGGTEQPGLQITF